MNLINLLPWYGFNSNLILVVAIVHFASTTRQTNFNQVNIFPVQIITFSFLAFHLIFSRCYIIHFHQHRWLKESDLFSSICHYGCTGVVMWDHMCVISFVQHYISSHHDIDDPALPHPPPVILICPDLSLYSPAALPLLPVVLFIPVPDVLATVAPAALPVCLCIPQHYFPIPHLS